ncbi:trans-sulfuration enzyme family protein [Aquipuribacter hungaricus]|uniref:Trans-sulfuration enzyme family protein n=1 Tax=Aquipuribacter hungaricus TaxID=545624 RepID=A0ABV7WFV0_9MICO
MQPTPDSPLAPQTRLVHLGRPARVPGGPLNPPVELSTTLHAATDESGGADAGVVNYARSGVPTWQALEEALGDLEGGTALVLGSGIAAVGAAVQVVLDERAGSGRTPVVVAPAHGYSGTLGLLDHLRATGRIDLVSVDPADTGAIVAAVDGADLLWVESPVNPTMEVTDLVEVCGAARRAGARSVVDSTYATPLLQNPLALGADVVVHSLTKSVAGHSDVLLGATVTADDGLAAALHDHRTRSGAVPGPFETWLALRGLRTLDVRLQRAQENAQVLAERLLEHPAVLRVRYPGLPSDPGHEVAGRQMRGPGTLLAVDLAGAREAEALAAAVRVWTHATSLGGVESLLERRRRHSGERGTVPEGLVRLSVGIEHVEDLWADLAQALDATAR